MRALLELGSALALLGVPLACCTSLADAVALPKRALLAVAASLVVTAWLSSGRYLRRGFLGLAGPGLFLWLVCVTCLRGWPPEGQSDAWTALALSMLGAGWCALLTPERERRWTLYAVTAAGLAAAYAWVQRLGWDPLPWSNPHLARERTIATFGNPDYLALYLVVVAPLALERVLGLRGKARWAGLAAWLAGALALALTTTRGSWLAALVAFLLWRRRQAVVLVLLLAVLALFQQGDFSLAARARSLANPRDLSFTTRLYLWRTALHLPGLGYGHFPFRALAFRGDEPPELRPLERMPEDPHSQYFQMLVVGGWPALLLWLALLAVAFRRLSGAPRAALGALAVNGLFVTLTPEVLVLWLLLLAKAAQAEPLLEGRRLPPVGLVAVALACWLGGRAVAADYLLLNGEDLPTCERALALAPNFRRGPIYERIASWHFERGSLEPGLEACRQAVALAPENPYRWAGQAYFCERLGRVDEAETAYRRAVALDPYNSRLWTELGALLAGAGRLEPAVEAFRRSFSAYPRGEVALDLGHALLLLGRRSEAEQALAEAVRLNPGLEGQVRALLP